MSESPEEEGNHKNEDMTSNESSLGVHPAALAAASIGAGVVSAGFDMCAEMNVRHAGK